MCAECVAVLKGEANARGTAFIATDCIVMPGSQWEHTIFHQAGGSVSWVGDDQVFVQVHIHPVIWAAKELGFNPFL